MISVWGTSVPNHIRGEIHSSTFINIWSRGLDLKLISTVSRRFLLALVVAASPFAFGQSPVEAAPMTVTVTLYSTISGPGNYGYCRQGTEDMGDPYGNVDFGNAGVELGELQGRPVATWGQVNYGSHLKMHKFM
jgi:hypothetical protein